MRTAPDQLAPAELAGLFHWVHGRESGPPPDGEPPLLGDTMLDFARTNDPEIGAVVNDRGRPDGIAVGPSNEKTWLVYLESGVIVETSTTGAHSVLTTLNDVATYYLRMRFWNDMMGRSVEWDPDRFAQIAGRVLSVYSRVIRALDPKDVVGERPWYNDGVIWLRTSALTAARYGHSLGMDHLVAVYVDPGGPSAEGIEVGDLCLSVRPCDDSAAPSKNPECVRYRLEHHGRVSEREVARETWPLAVSVRIVPSAAEGAFAYDQIDPKKETRDHVIFITMAVLVLQHGDDVLGFLLAHELGHHVKKHLVPAEITWDRTVDFATDLLIAPERAWSDFGRPFTVNRPRENEIEADEYGARLALRAGYDPTAAAEFLEAAERAGHVDAAHPAAADRLERIRAIVAEK